MINSIEKSIKARLEKGWFPTKNQCTYINDYILPNFDITCDHCLFNIYNYLGIKLPVTDHIDLYAVSKYTPPK